ncbi:MAG: hypothetical protein H2069_01970 [Legionella sp.]|nr:hypothetical protein [Legionella sp.]
MFILHYIHTHQATEITFPKIYQSCPNLKDQTPGEIVEYGLAELIKLERKREQENYTPKQWRDFKQAILDKLSRLITTETISSFSGQNCSLSLQHIEEFNNSEKRGYKLPELQINLLTKRFHEKRLEVPLHCIAKTLSSLATLPTSELLGSLNSRQVKELIQEMHRSCFLVPGYISANALDVMGQLALLDRFDFVDPSYAQDFLKRAHQTCWKLNPKNIAKVMWGLSKLSEVGKLDTFDPLYIHDFLARLYEQRNEAKLHDIMSVLRSLKKLLELGKLDSFKSLHIDDLIAHLQPQHFNETPHNIANMLYLLGKMVEFNQLDTFEPEYVYKLVDQLCKQRYITGVQEFALAVWACGIIHTLVPLNLQVIEPLLNITPMLHLTDNEANQILMGVCLLGLQHKYESQLAPLIKQCRPISHLSNSCIAPYIANVDHWKKEAFLYPFYVDLLIEKNGKKQVIEFDGPHHHLKQQQCFDRFRDKLIRKKGYEIIRISYENEKNIHAAKRNGKNSARFYPEETAPLKQVAIPRIYQKPTATGNDNGDTKPTRIKFSNY